MLIVIVAVVVSVGRLVGRSPEGGRSHHKHDDGNDHPGHGHQGKRVAAVTVGASRPRQSILATLVVSTVGLGLSQEVE